MGMGMFLLRRVYEGYLSGEATQELPVDGTKEGLVAHGQAGQQAATGRMESAVEIRDNVAAFACGEVLLDRSRRRISRREAAERLREILAK